MTHHAREGSARPSGRVDKDRGPATEFTGLYVTRAPETTAGGSTPGAGPERIPGRVGPRHRERLARTLSERDWAIVKDIAQYRFLTTAHVQALHFNDHRTLGAAARVCRGVLYRLAGVGVIEHLERRVGGVRAGSSSYVWRIGPVGDRLLRRADAPRSRRKEPSTRLLEHTLAASDCAVRLRTAARTGSLELLRIESEPATWRRYLAAGAAPETLKPDLFAVTASGAFEDHWFIEIDRATESLPTVRGKCAQYERFRRTGKAQAEDGVLPRVLWLVPDEQRKTSLRAAIDGDRALARDLFSVLTDAELVPLITGAPS